MSASLLRNLFRNSSSSSLSYPQTEIWPRVRGHKAPGCSQVCSASQWLSVRILQGTIWPFFLWQMTLCHHWQCWSTSSPSVAPALIFVVLISFASALLSRGSSPPLFCLKTMTHKSNVFFVNLCKNRRHDNQSTAGCVACGPIHQPFYWVPSWISDLYPYISLYFQLDRCMMSHPSADALCKIYVL